MTSLFAQIMEPGGGILLLPLVRIIIGCLLCLTISAAIMNIAQIHMIILSILSFGLFVSLHWFEVEFQKVRTNQQQQQQQGFNNATASTVPTTNAKPIYSNSNKTD